MAKKSKKNSKQNMHVLQHKQDTVISATQPTCSTCKTPCPCASCPQRILVVGGIERMEPLYREVIEAKGHIFEYRAGHLRKGGNKLDNLLQRADIVLCPVNCNSHTACLQVKSMCKKYKKNLQIMKNFSLSAIERTLVEVVNQ